MYDPKTSAVVKELQRSKGWGPDGKVGPLTVGAIKGTSARRQREHWARQRITSLLTRKDVRCTTTTKARLRDLKLQL